MRISELRGAPVVIWGLGREGKAAAAFLRQIAPDVSPVFVDEGDGPAQVDGYQVIRDASGIAAALASAALVVKSPGVSLYHPLIAEAQRRGVTITSLLNLWLAEPHRFTTIAVTGTKGKSTVSALLAHGLNALGKTAVAVGNIGVPVTEAATAQADYVVIEVSSYQAASLAAPCDIGVLTSLYPEHLDWHGSLAAYYRDKLNLLAHSETKIINYDTIATIDAQVDTLDESVLFNHPAGLHVRDGKIYDQDLLIGRLQNRHLARAHNLVNVCAVLAVLQHLGFAAQEAMPLMEDFRGLPHRQCELGEKNGVLYVDDSISTTPQSAIAAMAAYSDRPITLIAGGFDRGIDYAPLVDYVRQNKTNAVICMGPSGTRIAEGLRQGGYDKLHSAATMDEVARIATQLTPRNGVVLLSPAAPSYGLFKDFTARGAAFAAACGFEAPYAPMIQPPPNTRALS